MNDELNKRTKAFAVRIIKLASALQRNTTQRTLANQLLRSGTAIGAAYREACHSSSKRHFVTTLEIAQREANETAYWLELLVESELMPKQRLAPMIDECRQIHAMLTASIVTAKRRK